MRDALRQLRGAGEEPLRVIVLLWDGGRVRAHNVDRVLARADRLGVHVWSLGFGYGALTGNVDDLVALGGGDVYLAGDFAGFAARQIISELRFPDSDR